MAAVLDAPRANGSDASVVVVQLALFGPAAVKAPRPVQARRPKPKKVDAVTMELRMRNRLADRRAVQEVLVQHGYEHAVPTAVTAIAAELLGLDALASIPVIGDDAGMDAQLRKIATACEAIIYDATAYFMRQQGWRRR